MTKAEAIDLLKNRKVYVNGKSKEIQEKLFELGFEWLGVGKKVVNVDCPFLYTTDKRISFGYDMELFLVDKRKELCYSEIIAIEVVEELKENDVVVSGHDEGEWIAVIRNGEAYNYQYKVFLFLKTPFVLNSILGFDSIANSQDWTRPATEEEKQKLIDALKLSSDGRAKQILKDVFCIDDCPFKPFDKVLVRDADNEEWKPDVFWKKTDDNNYPYLAISNGCFAQCIPYEGHESLLDTTKSPEE